MNLPKAKTMHENLDKHLQVLIAEIAANEQTMLHADNLSINDLLTLFTRQEIAEKSLGWINNLKKKYPSPIVQPPHPGRIIGLN